MIECNYFHGLVSSFFVPLLTLLQIFVRHPIRSRIPLELGYRRQDQEAPNGYKIQD